MATESFRGMNMNNYNSLSEALKLSQACIFNNFEFTVFCTDAVVPWFSLEKGFSLHI